jgi:hypothetical protein
MRREFFGTIITPVVGMARTCMIALSTIQGQDNYYSQLLNLRDEITGRPFFNIYKFNLACEACIASNKAKDCKHRLDELPDYLAPHKQLQIRQILKQIGLESALEQETLNISSTANDSCFSPALVERLFTKDEFIKRTSKIELAEIPYVWCCIDPNSSGSSCVAICSAFQDRGSDNFIFCGGDLLHTTATSAAIPWIFKHFEAIRSLPKLQNAMIFLFVENNNPSLVYELGIRINNHQEVRDVVLINRFGFDTETVELDNSRARMHHGHRVGHGLATTNVVKEKMTQLFKEGLQLGKFSFYEHFTSVYASNPDDPNQDLVRLYKNNVKEQLKAWSKCVRIPKDPMSATKIKYTYSGKHNGPDDGAMSMLLLVYYISYHIRNRWEDIQEMMRNRYPAIS